MSAVDNDTEEYSWNIISKYFKHNPKALVEHHIDSYNLFVNKGIYNILKERNPIEIRKSYMKKHDSYKFECNIYIGGKDGSAIYYGKPIIYDSKNTHFMFPNEARLRNMTYGVTVYYDMVVEFQIRDEENELVDPAKDGHGKIIPHVLKFPKILLGKIPIMLQSSICAMDGLDRDLRFQLGECKNDYGGYFIIDGKEKVIIPQEKFADNMMYIKENSGDSHYSHSAIIRNVSEDASKPVRTMKIHIVRPTGVMSNNQIVVDIPNVRKPVPLFILFRALGITSDKKILEYILLDIDKNDTLLDYFIPSIHDTHSILTQTAAIQYIKTFTKGKTIYHAHEILSNYLLPQFGEQNYTQKAYYLGHMTLSLLKVFLKLENPTDRDSFSFKRIELPGNLLYDLFNEYYTLYKKQIFLNIDKDINYNYKTKIELGEMTADQIGDVFTTSMSKYTKDRVLDAGIRKAFKGSWGASNHTRRPGVLQDLSRLSYNSFISNLRKLNLPLDASAKVVGPRLCHSSQYGIIDPIDTPDGGNCGLHKHLTICSYITNGYSSHKMIDWMKNNIDMQFIDDMEPTDLYSKIKIFVNGRWIAVCDKLYENVQLIRNCRRLSVIPLYTSVSYSVPDKTIFVSTDYGRLSRPLYYATNNQQVDFSRDIKDYSWQQILCGNFKKDEFNFKNNKFYTIEELYGDRESVSSAWDKNRAILDLVDTGETESLLIAHHNLQVREKQRQYTHLELHNSLMFGYMGNLVIFPEHNQLPRNLFSCGQSKQACSHFHTNYQHRFDKSAIVLHYGQTPLVKSRYIDMFNNEEHPYGVNTIVAIGSYGGYNVEDAILVNRGAVDRGLFRTTYYNTYETREESSTVNSDSGDVKIMNPYSDNVSGMNPNYNYDKLNKHGLIDEETLVTEKTVIIGRAGYDESSGSFVDSSITTKKAQNGIVDKTFISTQEEGFRIAKVRVREERIPAMGDKMCSRAGQKGTIGLIIDEEDMPFTADGIKPDLIINPHALPSRMTIGQLIECVMGKACALAGTFGDATAYCNDKNGYKIFGDMLQKNGYNSHGNEILYNGMTGEQLESEIFIGPTYYLRLKHMVKDKINYRAKGPKQSLTRQPVKGRANDGGLRIGEMERDGVLGHGASKFLNESMLERGDVYYMAVCNKTGCIACYNEELNIFFSPFADGPAKFDGELAEDLRIKNVTKYGRSFSIVKVPYSFKLLIQELQSMNINMRIITDDNIDQMMNLNYTDNYKIQSRDMYSKSGRIPDTMKSIADTMRINNRINNANNRNERNFIRGMVELPDVIDDDDDKRIAELPQSPDYAPSGNSPDLNTYNLGVVDDDDGPFWSPDMMNDDNKIQPDESNIKFDGDDAEEKFVEFYKKRFPGSEPDVIEMAYSKFLEDGEIVDAKSILIPDDFEKADKPDIKKTFINRTGVPDIRTLENEPDDDDKKDGNEDDEVDTGDMDGGEGKFVLKKIQLE